MRSHLGRTKLTLAVLAGLAGAGCREDEPSFKTVTLSGTVERVDLPTGRMEISYENEKGEKRVISDVLTTPDTEVFINGELARLSDLRVGERAEGEAVVTRDDTRQIITVTRVRVERPLPMSRPASQPE